MEVPWGSLVGFDIESGALGTTYHFYLATSRRLSANVNRAARGSFGIAVRSELSRYEDSLPEPEASRRLGDVARVGKWKEEMLARASRLTEAGWTTNSLVKAGLVLPDGSTATGFVTLDQIGIFVEEEHGRRARLPYDTLGEFGLGEAGALVAPCDLEDIRQVTVLPDDCDVWLDDYELRRQDWWV